MEYFEVLSYNDFDIEPVVSMLDYNLNASFIGPNDDVKSPHNDANKIFVIVSPYTYYCKICDERGFPFDYYKDGIIEYWNEQTQDFIQYAFTHSEKTQPITYESLIGSTSMDTLSIVSARFDIPFTENYYERIEGLETEDGVASDIEKLDDKVKLEISNDADNDLLDKLEYNYYEGVSK